MPRLVKGKGSIGRGAGEGGYYWHIYVRDARVGYVCINWIDEPSVGPHASLQIQINARSQGKGIGSLVYRIAAESSSYNTVYAHMRKSNMASMRAAVNAGFKDVIDPQITQRLMVWHRNKN